MLLLLFADCFSKLTFSKSSFREHLQIVKRFGSKSGSTFYHPDLDPNCLQRLKQMTNVAASKVQVKFVASIYMNQK